MLNDALMKEEELVIKLTDDCEKEFHNLSDQEQDEVIEKAEYFGELYITDRAAFFRNAHQPLFFRLNEKFESSLYYFKLNNDLKMIASVDEDPIFGSLIITLIKVFRGCEIEKNFRIAAHFFYRHFPSVEQI